MANGHKLCGLKQHEFVLPFWKWLSQNQDVSQAVLFSGGSKGFVALPFPDSGGFPPPLVRGPLAVSSKLMPSRTSDPSSCLSQTLAGKGFVFSRNYVIGLSLPG